MPYKCENIKLNEKQDRRRKLTLEQKQEIKKKYATGLPSLNSLAKDYEVSKKTILLIVNESSKQKNDERIKEHWKDYYNKEEHTIAMRKLRRYKQSLYLNGDLR